MWERIVIWIDHCRLLCHTVSTTNFDEIFRGPCFLGQRDSQNGFSVGIRSVQPDFYNAAIYTVCAVKLSVVQRIMVYIFSYFSVLAIFCVVNCYKVNTRKKQLMHTGRGNWGSVSGPMIDGILRVLKLAQTEVFPGSHNFCASLFF